jgi:hypothetical protein
LSGGNGVDQFTFEQIHREGVSREGNQVEVTGQRTVADVDS